MLAAVRCVGVGRTLFAVALLGAASRLLAADPYFDAKGFDPKREYVSLLPFEHVDPMTGNLLLTFTDLVMPGNAGFELRVQRTYNSKIFKQYSRLGGAILREDSWAGLGWSLHFGRIHNPDSRSPVIEMPDGSQHQAFPHMDGDPNHYMTRDFWTFDSVARVVRLPNGVRYTFDHATYNLARATRIEDPFGNVIVINYARTTRNWPVSPDVIANVQQHLGGGQVRTVTFEYDATLPNPVDGTPQGVDSLRSMSLAGTGIVWQYRQRALAEVGYTILDEAQPPLGPSWRFGYYAANDWPTPYLLRRVATPNGGQIEYSYVDQIFYLGSQAIDTPALSTRTTSGPDIVSGTWNYSYSSPSGFDSIQSSVTAPCGQQVTYTFWGIGPYGDEMPWRIGSMKTKTVSGAGVLEQETQQWAPSVAISNAVESGNSFQTHVALVQSRTIQRGSGTYTTLYSYNAWPYSSGNASNFNDYGRAFRIDEQGELSRTTTRSFFYGWGGDPSFGTYIVDKVASETVTVGWESFSKSYTYDSSTGFMLSQNIFGIQTSYQPTGRGNVRVAIDANNHRTRYDYDWGVVSLIDTPQYTVTRQINSDGTIASETRRGFTTYFAYDALLRMTQKRPPVGNAITTQYDNYSARTVTTRRGSSSTTVDLDGFGRAIRSVNSVGVRTETRCDACGRKIYESYPYTGASTGTSFTLDALGRVTRATHPDNSYVRYDYSGIDVTIMDEENRPTSQNRSAFGDPDESRLVSVTDADSQVTRYDYNALGSLTAVTSPGGSVVRRFQYNERNELDSETHPENGIVSYTYDPAGNMQTRIDQGFGMTTFGYDGNNRLVRVDRPGTAYDVTFGYDESDNRTSAVNSYVSSQAHFDGANRLYSQTDVVGGHSFPTGYSYDDNDNLTGITYPSGTSVGYGYDSENRIARVTGNQRKVLAQGLEYHPSGAPTSFRSGNNVLQQFSYDNRYRLGTLSASGLLSLGYGYDHVGNVRSISDTRAGMSQTYTPDRLDRVTDANGPWGQARYGYDALGNRLSKAVAGASTTYSYDPGTQRLASASGAESGAYQYDQNGNTIQDQQGHYSYAPQNQMETAIVGGVATTYRYDGDDQRKIKSDGQTTHYYLHSPSHQILSEFEQDNTGPLQVVRDYVYAGTRLIAAIKPTVLLVSPTSLTFAAALEGPLPSPQVVSITNTGSDRIGWTATTSDTWLRVAQASGTTPTDLAVSVDPTGLTLGEHDGSITISAAGASGSPRVVSVRLIVTQRPALVVLPTQLSFLAMAGRTNPTPQQLDVVFGGDPVNWSAVASDPWLVVSAASGATPASIAVSVDAAGLSDGHYSGSITVSASGVEGSPQVIPIDLVVQPGPGMTCESDAWYCEPFDELAFGNLAGQAGWVPGTPASGQVIADPRGVGKALVMDARSRQRINESVDLAQHPVDGSEISFQVMTTGVLTGSKQIAKIQFNTPSGGAWGKTQNTFGALRFDTGMLMRYGRNAYLRLLDTMEDGRWYGVRVRYADQKIQAYVDGVLTATVDNPLAVDFPWGYIDNSAWALPGAAYLDLIQIRDVATTPTPSLVVEPSSLDLSAGTGTSEVFFEDQFGTLDTSKWNTSIATSGVRFCDQNTQSTNGTWLDVSVQACKGGTVSAPYGVVALTADGISFSDAWGRAFPYIWAGPPSRPSPFPQTGNFVFEMRMRYDSISPNGDGVVLVNLANSDPVGNNPPMPAGGASFGVWADTSSGSDTQWHTYSYECIGCSNRPNTVWLGNATITPSAYVWTAFTVNYVRVTTLPSTPLSATLSIHDAVLQTGPAWQATVDVPWLSLSASSGDGPSAVTVTADPAGLADGVHTGNIVITADGAAGSPQTIPVTLTVGPQLVVEPSSIDLTIEEGAAGPAQGTLTIRDPNLPTGPAWEAVVDVPWLTLDASSGTGPSTVTVSADPTGLAVGTYQATVTVTAGVPGSPRVIQVTLSVIPAGSGGGGTMNNGPGSGASGATRWAGLARPHRAASASAELAWRSAVLSQSVEGKSAANERHASAAFPLTILALGGIAALPVRSSRWRKRRSTSLLVLLFCLFAAPASAETVEYYHTDGVGNVRVVTEESGAVIERHDYLPFGEECTTGACASNPGVGAGQPRKFTGKERDTETGLDYFGARYYGSKIARFTAVDPAMNTRASLADPQRWNRYAYGRNNPLAFSDPDGRDMEVVVNFRGYTQAEQSAVTAAVRGYLSRTDVGNVVVRASTDTDNRTLGQRLVDALPGNSGYYTTTADADLEGVSKPHLFRGGALKSIRESDPESYAARTADGVLHEVIAHQAKIGRWDDSFSMGEYGPDTSVGFQQQKDRYFRTRKGTLMDHVQCRQGACPGGAMESVRGLYHDDKEKLEAGHKPIERSYR